MSKRKDEALRALSPGDREAPASKPETVPRERGVIEARRPNGVRVLKARPKI